jgi:hypothetical protein
MFYVLEFFREDEAGVRQRLRSSGYEAPSEERAVQYAQAFLRNVTVQGQTPDVCLIKNVGGKVLSVVLAQAPASAAAKQETS